MEEYDSGSKFPYKNKDKIQRNPKIKKFLAIIKYGDLVLRADGSITTCTAFYSIYI